MIRNSLFFIFLFTLTFNSIVAQDFNFTYSEEFEEPGTAKLKLLSNGNTILISDGKVKLYNSSNKVIGETDLSMRNALFNYFEVNQNLVFFFRNRNMDNYTSSLNRIIVSGTSAEIISKEKIHEFPEVTGRMDNAYLRNDPDYKWQTFEISKDRYSDYYAVAILNGYLPDPDKKVEVIHYSPEHKEINRANLKWLDPNYKNVCLSGIFVNSSEYILLGTGMYNKRGISIALSRLNNGSKDFEVMPIQYTTTSFDYGICKFEYDKKKNIVYSFWQLSDFQKNTTLIQPYNPSTKSLMSNFGLPMNKANLDYLAKGGKQKGFSGMPHNLCMDSNGNLTVLLEETSKFSSNSFYYTYLEDPVITNFSADGKENYGFAFPYAGKLQGDHPSLFYYNNQNGAYYKKGWYVPKTELAAYAYHLDMVQGDKYTYLFLNGSPERLESAKVNVYPSFVLGTSFAYYYKIDADGKIVQNYLFDRPSNPLQNQFGLFYTSDYDSVNKRYAAITVKREGAVKRASIVWFKLE